MLLRRVRGWKDHPSNTAALLLVDGDVATTSTTGVGVGRWRHCYLNGLLLRSRHGDKPPPRLRLRLAKDDLGCWLRLQLATIELRRRRRSRANHTVCWRSRGVESPEPGPLNRASTETHQEKGHDDARDNHQTDADENQNASKYRVHLLFSLSLSFGSGCRTSQPRWKSEHRYPGRARNSSR